MDRLGARRVNLDLGLAAASRTAVLITAANRKTRERCARLIHFNGNGAEAPFAIVRCGGRPPEAQHRLAVLDDALAATRGGTLFLDDVGNLGPDGQRRLLAATVSREVRIIAGTNRSLLPAVTAGTFDETLFYRLNVVHLLVRGSRSHDIA